MIKRVYARTKMEAHLSSSLNNSKFFTVNFCQLQTKQFWGLMHHKNEKNEELDFQPQVITSGNS